MKEEGIRNPLSLLEMWQYNIIDLGRCVVRASHVSHSTVLYTVHNKRKNEILSKIQRGKPSKMTVIGTTPKRKQKKFFLFCFVCRLYDYIVVVDVLYKYNNSRKGKEKGTLYVQ